MAKKTASKKVGEENGEKPEVNIEFGGKGLLGGFFKGLGSLIDLADKLVGHFRPLDFVVFKSHVSECWFGQIVAGGKIIRLEFPDNFQKHGRESVNRSGRLALRRCERRKGVERTVQNGVRIKKHKYFFFTHNFMVLQTGGRDY